MAWIHQIYSGQTSNSSFLSVCGCFQMVTYAIICLYMTAFTDLSQNVFLILRFKELNDGFYRSKPSGPSVARMLLVVFGNLNLNKNHSKHVQIFPWVSNSSRHHVFIILSMISIIMSTFNHQSSIIIIIIINCQSS